jgi:hypothetical protein
MLYPAELRGRDAHLQGFYAVEDRLRGRLGAACDSKCDHLVRGATTVRPYRSAVSSRRTRLPHRAGQGEIEIPVPKREGPLRLWASVERGTIHSLTPLRLKSTDRRAAVWARVSAD